MSRLPNITGIPADRKPDHYHVFWWIDGWRSGSIVSGPIVAKREAASKVRAGRSERISTMPCWTAKVQKPNRDWLGRSRPYTTFSGACYRLDAQIRTDEIPKNATVVYERPQER